MATTKDLFNRNIEVYFGKKDSFGGTSITKIKDLKINFSVSKTKEKDPNTATITIFNMNKDHRAELENTTKIIDSVKNVKEQTYGIQLNVGYGNNLEVLFLGDIKETNSKKNGSDYITEITAGDGDKALRDTYFQKSYKAGTNKKTIINDIIKSFSGISIGKIDSIEDDTSQQGITVSGFASELLDKFLSNQNKEWSIQNGEIQILGSKETTNEEAIVLSPKTGLIGIPQKTEKGIEFEALIQARIRPGRLIRINSNTITGDFKIVSADFTGSNMDNDFKVKGVATSI